MRGLYMKRQFENARSGNNRSIRVYFELEK